MHYYKKDEMHGVKDPPRLFSPLTTTAAATGRGGPNNANSRRPLSPFTATGVGTGSGAVVDITNDSYLDQV